MFSTSRAPARVGDRHRAHVDPVRRREIARREGEEAVAVEDQRDDPDIEHPAPQPHREREEVELQPVRLRPVAGDERRQHRDRLGGDHGDKPGPGDAVLKRRLVTLDRERREDRVGEADPKHDAQRQEQGCRCQAVRDQQELNPEDAGPRNRGEEAGPEPVVGHVAEEQPRVAHGSERGQHRQHRVGNQVEHEQRRRQEGKMKIPCRDGHDPGGHNQCEIGGRKVFHGTRTSRGLLVALPAVRAASACARPAARRALPSSTYFTRGSRAI